MKARDLLAVVAFLVGPMAAAQEPRTDRFGDPLPAGAVHRLGSVRLNPDGGPNHLAFTPDGKLLVTGRASGFVQVWDAGTGKLVRSWPEIVGGHLAVSPDGNWLAVSTYNGALRIHDIHSGKLKHTLFPNSGGVVQFSPDGKTLACGHWRSHLILYDVVEGGVKRSLGPFLSTCLAYSSDGRYLAAGSGTDSPHDTVHANVWETATGKLLCSIKLERASGSLRGVAFVPGKRQLLVSSIQLTLHDIDTGKLIRVVGETGIGSLRADRAGKRMVASRGQLWDLEKLEVIHRLPESAYDYAAISADGTRAATSLPLRVWDTATGKPTFAPPGHGAIVHHAAFSLDDRRIVTLPESEGVLHVWDAQTGAHVESLGQKRPPNKHHLRGPLRCADDGKRLTAGWELWDLAGKKRLPTFYDVLTPKDADWPSECIRIRPDAKIAADWSFEKGIRIWDLATTKVLHTLPMRHQSQYATVDLAFTADGKTLAATYYAGENSMAVPTLFFIDVASGKVTHKLRESTDMAGFPQFSQDGRWLVINRREQGLEVWHVAGAMRARDIHERELPSHFPVFALAPHGQVLATSNVYHKVILYELASGQRIVRLPGHTERVASIAFAHNGRRFVTGSEDRTALVWSFDLLAPTPLPKDDERLWTDLAGDAAKAYPLLWALTNVPPRAVALAQARLQPDPTADAKALERLIADLGSAIFAKRQRATETLQALGPDALPALQAALDRANELEVRRRIVELLQKMRSEPPPPALLRDLRVIQLLEMIGSPESRQTLTRIAAASKEGPRAVAARSALGRLDVRRVD